MVKHNYFPPKNFFRKENIQFSSRRFSSFSWNCPWRAEFKSAELVSWIIQVSAVTTVRTPEEAGSNSAVDQIFLRLFRFSLTSPYFLTAQIRVFFDKNLRFFGKWAFFSQKLPFFRRNWSKWFFYNNLRKNSQFSWKTEKSFQVISLSKSLLKFNYKRTKSTKFSKFYVLVFSLS